jgi:hypothetical protein
MRTCQELHDAAEALRARRGQLEFVALVASLTQSEFESFARRRVGALPRAAAELRALCAHGADCTTLLRELRKGGDVDCDATDVDTWELAMEARLGDDEPRRAAAFARVADAARRARAALGGRLAAVRSEADTGDYSSYSSYSDSSDSETADGTGSGSGSGAGSSGAGSGTASSGRSSD